MSLDHLDVVFLVTVMLMSVAVFFHTPAIPIFLLTMLVNKMVNDG